MVSMQQVSCGFQTGVLVILFILGVAEAGRVCKRGVGFKIYNLVVKNGTVILLLVERGGTGRDARVVLGFVGVGDLGCGTTTIP